MTNPATAAVGWETAAPPAKRLMRAIWTRLLPRTHLTFNIGKLITRTVLKPDGTPHPVRVTFAGSVPMTLDLGTFVANDLFCMDDHYESVTLRLWRRLAQDASVILDIGSHIGTFALVAASTNPKARIVSVEADGNIFALLREHTTPFPNITALHAAIADRESPMWFCPIGGNDGGGFLSLTRPDDPRSYPVTTQTLSRLCTAQGIGGVDLMKMDVEGFEHVLLTHDDAFFNAHAPRHVIVELTIDRADPGPTEALFAAMRRRGYEARRIQGLYALPFGKRSDLANWHFQRHAVP
jgi:FkbM family methyltransferase